MKAVLLLECVKVGACIHAHRQPMVPREVGDDGADVGRIGARRGIDVARWLIGNVRRCEDADDIVHRRVDG